MSLPAVLQQPGRIDAIRGTRASVSVVRKQSCERCASGRGCGLGLGDPGRNEPATLDLSVPAGVALSVGDPVTVAIGEPDLLRAAFIGYGIPATGLVAGAIGSAVLGLTEPATVGVSLFGLGLACWLARGRARRALPRCEPRLLVGHPADGRADA